MTGRDDGVRGRTILVTGGTGRIGTALVDTLRRADAGRIRVFARNAPRAPLPDDVEMVAGDVADGDAVRRAVSGVHIVFHLAGEKYVELCEADPAAAVRQNVVGSMSVLDAAIAEASVTCFVAASSAKAAEPAGVYGATKALLERLICSAAGRSRAAFAAVRLAGVPGDGVIASWKRSARERGEIDVTDERMTRFVMSLEDVVDALLSATRLPESGCVLVRRPAAYCLADLAAVVASAYAARISVVGRRPGEALHEFIVSPREAHEAQALSERDIVLTPGRTGAGVPPLGSEAAPKLDRASLSRLFQIEAVANA